MGVIYLSVELSLDILSLIMGVILTIKAKDNYPKFYWGIIAIAIGGVFAWENIGWLTIVTETPEYRFNDILNIEKMLKWYPMASIVALFPIASLSPGYLTPFKITIFLLPSILITTIGLCYIGFNGNISQIYSIKDIIDHINNTDIILRLVIFISSVISPLLFFLYPIVYNKAYRKINRTMYFFMSFMFLFLIIYIIFTLSINEFIFNLFGATAIVFTVVFSIQYYLRENPFSDYICNDTNNIQNSDTEKYLSSTIFNYIDDTIKNQCSYTNPEYNIKTLAEESGYKEQQISKAIKSAGFSSFREYINNMRLEHFRMMVEKEKDSINIKEFIFMSGFKSRATFYRNFTDKYGTSPSQYIDSIKTKV